MKLEDRDFCSPNLGALSSSPPKPHRGIDLGYSVGPETIPAPHISRRLIACFASTVESSAASAASQVSAQVFGRPHGQASNGKPSPTLRARLSRQRGA